MFLPGVKFRGDNILHGFPENVFFRCFADLIIYWQSRSVFGHMMIQKRYASFHRMGHLHLVTQMVCALRGLIAQARYQITCP